MSKPGDIINLSDDPGRFALRLMSHRTPWGRGLEFLLFAHARFHGDIDVIAKDVSFVVADPDRPGIESPPTFKMGEAEAQALMDSLWANGIRPVDGSGSAGQRAATEKHLDDMREIVASQLGVKL